MTKVPLSGGSISIRLYRHDLDDPVQIVSEILHQAQLAASAGFDGVMITEHHGGFGGYLPNPIQIVGWILDAVPEIWAAPCPLLLPLRPPALVAEEIAWLEARHPGRVGLGVAAGSLVDDFDIMGLTKDDLTQRFADGLTLVAGMLQGTTSGLLAGDPAIRRCVTSPIPFMSAAMSPVAARRAAAAGAGVILDSLTQVARARQVVDAYRSAGGDGPVTLARRVWIGAPPDDLISQQMDVYRSYSTASAVSHFHGNQMLIEDDPTSIADELFEAMQGTGADGINIRVHVAGIAPEPVRDQIVALKAVVEALRSRF